MYHDLMHKGILQTIKEWIIADYNFNRFRPYYQAHIVVLTKIFGLRSTLWFSYIAILASLTFLFLFLFARNFNFSFLISLIFVLPMFLDVQSETWARPIIPDAHGMFFLSAALLSLHFCSKNNKYQLITNSIFMILVLLMSLCKESYIIFIPTLIVLKIWLYAENNKLSILQSLKVNIIGVILLSLLFCLEIFYILHFLDTNSMGYAGVDESSFNIFNIISTAQQFLWASYFPITLFTIACVFLLEIWQRQSVIIPFKKIFPFIVVFVVSFIPQIFLYSKSGIIAGFYLYPAIIGSLLLLAKSLSLLAEYSRFLYAILTTVILIILTSKIPLTWNTFLANAEQSKNTNGLLNTMELCVPKDDPIVIVVNPRVHYEASYSLKVVLKNAFNKSNLFVATYGLKETHFFSESYREREKQWSFLNPQDIVSIYENMTLDRIANLNNIQAVIVVDKLNKDFINTSKNWFFPEQYQLVNFSISPDLSFRLYCKKNSRTGSSLPAINSEMILDVLSHNVDFSKDTANVSLEGFSFPEDWGRWTDGSPASIKFAQDLPSSFELIFKAKAFGPNVNKDIIISVGSQQQKIQLTDKAQEIKVKFTGVTANERTITFTIPEPTSPKQLGEKDERKLGIAFDTLNIVETK
jgi:hypothetical protein